MMVGDEINRYIRLHGELDVKVLVRSHNRCSRIIAVNESFSYSPCIAIRCHNRQLTVNSLCVLYDDSNWSVGVRECDPSLYHDFT